MARTCCIPVLSVTNASARSSNRTRYKKCATAGQFIQRHVVSLFHRKPEDTCAALAVGHFLHQPGGNQVNPRLTLVRTGWAYPEEREREKKGERVWERERERQRDSGTRPEPQRAVTKRSLVTHTEAHSAPVSELDGLLNITSSGEEEVPSVRACS